MQLKSISKFDVDRYGYILRCTHGLPCACGLPRYKIGNIPLTVVHVICIRLSFFDTLSCESIFELFILQEFDVILNLF